MQLTTLPCSECGKTSQVEVTYPQSIRLRTEHVQEVFPEWPPEKRELLITGIHPECWKKIFNGEEW